MTKYIERLYNIGMKAINSPKGYKKEGATMTKQTSKSKAVSLDMANEQAKADYSQGVSAESVIRLLAERKGEALTPSDISEQIGTTAKSVRSAMQHSGLSRNQNAIIETTVNGKKLWIHLSKLTGGKNAYTATNQGVTL